MSPDVSKLIPHWLVLTKVLKSRNLNVKINSVLGALIMVIFFSGCSSDKYLVVKGIGYQSINTRIPQISSDRDIPQDASILTTYLIGNGGTVTVLIKNLTDKIITIDQEKSFFIDPSGTSHSYYDPTVHVTSKTDYAGKTSGSSVNLSGLIPMDGVKGPLKSLLGGINISQSSTNGSSVSNTILSTGQKKVSIGPKGIIALERGFKTGMLGSSMTPADAKNTISYQYDNSPVKFSICISYSLNNEITYETLVTDFYASTYTFYPIEQNKNVNNVLRNIMSSKPDLFSQPWYLLYFSNNISEQSILNGVLFDYQ